MNKLLVLLAVLPSFASAAEITVVEKLGQWALRDPAKTPIEELGRYATYDLCKAALVAAKKVGKFRCDTSVNLEASGVCSETPDPFPVKVVNGLVEVPEIRIRVNALGEWQPAEIQAMVKPPNRVFPNCWVIGWVLYTGQEYVMEEGPPEPVGEVWSVALEELHQNAISVERRSLP